MRMDRHLERSLIVGNSIWLRAYTVLDAIDVAFDDVEIRSNRTSQGIAQKSCNAQYFAPRVGGNAHSIFG
jgi:hypothetical protein